MTPERLEELRAMMWSGEVLEPDAVRLQVRTPLDGVVTWSYPDVIEGTPDAVFEMEKALTAARGTVLVSQTEPWPDSLEHRSDPRAFVVLARQLWGENVPIDGIPDPWPAPWFIPAPRDGARH